VRTSMRLLALLLRNANPVHSRRAKLADVGVMDP